MYRNTIETATFLDRASPAYMGGIIEMLHDRLYPFWGDLIEALRTGEPQNELKRTGKSLFDQLYTDPARLEQFLAAMSGASTGNSSRLRAGSISRATRPCAMWAVPRACCR